MTYWQYMWHKVVMIIQLYYVTMYEVMRCHKEEYDTDSTVWPVIKYMQ
jgi:hypothetical protein